MRNQGIINYSQIPKKYLIPWFFIVDLLSKWMPSIGLKNVFLRMMGIKIGAYSRVSPYVMFDPISPYDITIGKRCFLGMFVKILTHVIDGPIPLNNPFNFKRGKVIIGDRVLIGGETTIFPGICIGNDSIIGARSLVTKDVPANEIWFGQPAKKVGCVINGKRVMGKKGDR